MVKCPICSVKDIDGKISMGNFDDKICFRWQHFDGKIVMENFDDKICFRWQHFDGKIFMENFDDKIFMAKFLWKILMTTF